MPIIWCVDFLMLNGFDGKYSILVFTHLLYLVLLSATLIFCIWYVVSLTYRLSYYRAEPRYRERCDRQSKRVIFIIFVVLCAWFYLNWSSIPIFIGGSNAIVDLNEENKKATWFSYGILSLCVSSLLVSFAYQKRFSIKVILVFLIMFLAILPGKKSGLLSAVGMLLFVHFCLAGAQKRFPFFKVSLATLLGLLFIAFQYARTVGIKFDVQGLAFYMVELIYTHSTVYLRQFIGAEAIQVAAYYPEDSMKSGVLGYFLNPFYKIVFGTGIEKAIGPYVSNYLYGAGAGATGVNPTFFFEMIFVSGIWHGSILAFGVLGIWAVFMVVVVNNFIMDFNKPIGKVIFYLMFIGFLFSFMSDSLNAIRTLPFVLFPLFCCYFRGLFLKNS